MTTTWDSTPTARYLASLGWREPTEFRSAQQVSADWQSAYGTPPSEAQVRQSMLADRLSARVVSVDTGSVLGSAADRVAADGRTRVAMLDDAQVRAEVAARSAAIQRGAGTIRPGRADSGRPHWSKAKNAGLPWRLISFGPPGGFAEAGRIFAQWQLEDAVLQEAVNASLPPGYPR